MRVKIDHTTHYAYDRPIRSAVQVLRLTPRETAGQHIVSWRVEADADGALRPFEDALGNLSHVLEVDRPHHAISLHVSGEVETIDTGGVLSGAVERFPPEVYLRETELTEADAVMRAYAQDVVGGSADALDRLHALQQALHRDIAYTIRATDATTRAAEAFAMRRGVCQDLAHVFIAMARRLGSPARYVSGHLLRRDGIVEQEAAHAWAEAYVPHLGWVGFDPANGACPAEAHVRVAVGLDYLGAAPVRGSRTGGGAEQLSVRLQVAGPQTQLASQMQCQ